MKKTLLPLLVFTTAFLASQQSFGQRQCGVVEYHQMLQDQDPSFLINQNSIEEFTQRYIEEHGQSADRSIITIPVVVHVVYNTTAENISDAQVYSQINILNQDFRKLNADIWKRPGIF